MDFLVVEVVELEDDVAERRVRAVGHHRESRAVGRHRRLADPRVPRPAVDGHPAVDDPLGVAAVGVHADDARDRHLVVADDVGGRPVADALGRPDEVDGLPIGRPRRHRVVAAGRQLLDVLALLDPDVAGLGVHDRARDLVLLDLRRHDDDVRRGRRGVRRDLAIAVAVAGSRSTRRTGRCCRAG